MGIRKGRVTLDRVRVDFVPDRLKKARVSDSTDIPAVYESCYREVFGSNAKIPPLWKTGSIRKIESNIAKSRTPPDLFIRACMMIHASIGDDTPFFPAMLQGDSALHRVKLFKRTSAKEFASFSTETMEKLTGQKVSKYEYANRMGRSEYLVGRWLVGHKIRKGGVAYAQAFASLELSLDPLWLASDDQYFKHVFQPHIKSPSGSDEVKKHRNRVASIRKKMIRSKGYCRSVLESREKAFLPAIEKVLRDYGLSSGDLEIPDVPVTDPLQLWSRIGMAVQHWMCLRLVHGDVSARKALFGQ